MPPDIDVSLQTQIPQDIHQRLLAFLDANPAWQQDDFITAAISLLLVQLGDNSDKNVRLHLDRLYYKLWGKEAS